MINADTAIVGNGIFFHYCHSIKGFMALRTHHKFCPFCSQKNPDYIPNKLVHTVTEMNSGRTVLIFADIQKAVDYMQKHPSENLALGDTGYVDSGTI